MLYRVFVEKKPGLDPESAKLLADCRTFLGLAGLERLRVLNRYDLEGLDESLFQRVKGTVLSEPQLDTVTEALSAPDAAAIFAVEPLPGQFDQRADSAAQCVQLLSQGERPTVRTVKVYVLYGTLTAEDVAAVKSYVINPVESREASLELPKTLRQETAVPADVAVLTGFTALAAAGLTALGERMGLAMDGDDLPTMALRPIWIWATTSALSTRI